MAKNKRSQGLDMRGQLKLVPGYLILATWVSFTFVVLLWVIGASLSTTGDIFRGTIFEFSTGLHFENYSRAWVGSNVAVYFTNSLIYAVISCTLLILLCAPFAYVLVRHRFLGSRLIKTGLAAASGVPIIMVIIPLYMIIARAGLLKDEMTNRIVLITLFVGTKVPYTTIFLQPYFDSVSRAYEEAASIDGCHPIRAFWQIVFPMVQGGLITVTIFNFINIWNEYFLSLLFVNSEKLRPVALGLFSMINGMQVSGDWSGLFASVMIVFAPTFLIYIFLSKYIIGGLTGGVKG